MTHSALQNAILAVHPSFDKDSLQHGLSYFQRNSVEGKSQILEIGEVASSLFFVETSVSRCYYLDNENEEQTLWMKPEKQFITEYKSFTSETPSNFSLQLYENSIVHSITRKHLFELYENHQDWALWGLKLTEALHVTLIDVFVNLLANDATRNYQYIEYAFPRFLQVAPLKDIASMLQITPVTLSRIRAGNQTKY